MVSFIRNFKFYLLYWFTSLLAIPFLFWWISNAQTDILWELTSPSQNYMIYRDRSGGSEVKTIWGLVIWNQNTPTVIVRITRFLLILTITLAVTMILYNWMIYIIETWQWKEWKSLVKNVVLIVVWILVALFSVVIITLIQSTTTTLDKELPKAYDDILKNK